MKKIITLLIFLSVGILSAQTYTDYDKQEGRYWRGYKGTTLAQYVYVVNDSTSLAFLDSLITDLATSKGYLLNIKQNGDSIIVLVNLTNTRLSSVITDLDSIIVLHNLTNTKLDTLEITANAIETKVSTAAKQDSAEVTLNAIETKVSTAVKQDSLEVTANAIQVTTDAISGKVALAAKQDSLEVTANAIQAKVSTEAKQDTIEVTLNSIAVAVGATNTTLDSLEVTANNIETKVATAVKQDSLEVTANGIQTNTASTNTKLDSLDASSTRIEGYVDGAEAKLDSLDASSTRNETKLDNIYTRQADGNQTTRAVSYSSGGYGTVTISTVDTLSASSVPCSEVSITNNTAGSTLYVGYDGSVTSSNGYPLAYRDEHRIKISNLNKIYLIGSTTIDVRYVYNNY